MIYLSGKELLLSAYKIKGFTFFLDHLTKR